MPINSELTLSFLLNLKSQNISCYDMNFALIIPYNRFSLSLILLKKII
jgi:hypothetical protein